ncbi:MAG: hypothetical protein BroJett018_25750 [Chloroflexota bacterium]|nr:MAG: hypothetical protein BroJett018_25750 [Chloroflexota bacterium]
MNPFDGFLAIDIIEATGMGLAIYPPDSDMKKEDLVGAYPVCAPILTCGMAQEHLLRNTDSRKQRPVREAWM